MNKAIILYDCWDKHWDGNQFDLDLNCKKINNFVNYARSNNYLIIHHPSDCVGDKTEDNFILNPLPKTDLLYNISNQPLPGSKWKVWSKQNPNIEINNQDFITEDLNNLLKILKENSIEELYYVGYHINLCILWARKTSIGNLKQLIDIKTYIVKDLSKALLKNKQDLQLVYDICENEYNTNLIDSKEL